MSEMVEIRRKGWAVWTAYDSGLHETLRQEWSAEALRLAGWLEDDPCCEETS